MSNEYNFEEMANTQKDLELAFKGLESAFSDAQLSIKKRHELILDGIRETQKAEAQSLAQIGQALQKIIGSSSK